MLDAECGNWEEAKEWVIRDNGGGWDLGYTSAVRLQDGKVLVVYYYVDEKKLGTRYIAGTILEIQQGADRL